MLAKLHITLWCTNILDSFFRFDTISIFCFNNNRIYGEYLVPGKCIYVAVRLKAVVIIVVASLFIAAPIVCGGSVFRPFLLCSA